MPMTETLFTTDEQIEKMREEIAKAKQKEAGQKPSVLPLVKKIARQAAFWLLILFLFYVLYSVLQARSKGEIPQFFGYQLYSVESGSMAPTLKVGVVLLSHKVADPAALKVDDIVTFRMENGVIVTHRIIEVLKDKKGKVTYRTKGDNPINSPDPELLTPDRVIARLVAKIPFT